MIHRSWSLALTNLLVVAAGTRPETIERIKSYQGLLKVNEFLKASSCLCNRKMQCFFTLFQSSDPCANGRFYIVQYMVFVHHVTLRNYIEAELREMCQAPKHSWTSVHTPCDVVVLEGWPDT